MLSTPPGKTQIGDKLGEPASMLKPFGVNSSPKMSKRSATTRPVLARTSALTTSDNVTAPVMSTGKSVFGGITRPLNESGLRTRPSATKVISITALSANGLNTEIISRASSRVVPEAKYHSVDASDWQFD